MPKRLSEDIQKAIVAAVEAGIKRYDIQNTFNVSVKAISEILKRKRERGSLKMQGSQEDLIDLKQASTSINRGLGENKGIYVDDSTVRRLLRVGGLFSRMAVKKPFVSPKNRKARLKFAKKYIDWTEEEWSEFVERLIKVSAVRIGWKAICQASSWQRDDHRYQRPTVKHGGGSLMVWGASLARLLVQSTNLVATEKFQMSDGWIFQHDNDPKHKSKVVSAWLDEQEIVAMHCHLKVRT
uniref:Transposase Tc1-like domain-containing protein n=1 Tax=Ditylenchus dipsaci TaxID=166011 RepID=A0A915DI81_9BILA